MQLRRDLQVPDTGDRSKYRGVLEDRGDIAMLFRSQLVAILHLVLEGSGIRVENRIVGYQAGAASVHEQWLAVWRCMGGQHESRRNLKSIAGALRAAASRPHKHVVPLYGSMHWRVILVDPGAKGVYLFDPFGFPFTEGEAKAIKKAYREFQVRDLRLAVQSDSINCGVYVAWMAKTWRTARDAPTVGEQAEVLRAELRGCRTTRKRREA